MREREYEKKKITRADERSELLRTIEQIESDIVKNAHIQVIENLKVASAKLNLEKDSLEYENGVNALLLRLGINSDGGTWRLDCGGDRIAQSFTKSHEELNRIRRKITDIRKDTLLKRLTIDDIRLDQKNVLSSIKDLGKKVSEEYKWSSKRDKMSHILSELKGVNLVL